jgi:hypothetical protein
MRAIWRAWIGLVPLFAVLMGMIGTASAQQPKSATDGGGSYTVKHAQMLGDRAAAQNCSAVDVRFVVQNDIQQ